MKTPRTDQAAFTAGLVDIDIEVVDAYFARQLEIELADALTKLRKLGAKKEKENNEIYHSRLHHNGHFR